MTTRRSRLKAIANLPVRRKAPTFQENAVSVPVTDNSASGDDSASSEKNEVNSAINDLCHNDKLQKIIPDASLENKNKCDNKNNNENKLNIEINHESDATKSNFIEPSGIVVNKLIDSKSSKEENKKNEANETCLNNTKTTNKSSSNQYNKHNETSFVSSSVKKKEVNNLKSEKNEENQNLQLIKSSIQLKILNESNTEANEAVSTSALFAPDNSGRKTTLTATAKHSTQCKNSSPVTNMTDVNSQYISDDFNELNIYSNLVESTEFLPENLPRLVNNKVIEGSEVTLDNEESEPILTTLVNCSTEINFNNLNRVTNYEESNLLPSSSSDTDELFVNITGKSLSANEISNCSSNDGVSRNIINPVRDKLVADNLIYKEPQGILPNNNNNSGSSVTTNTTPKKNIATFKRKRSKCSDFTKKLANARREFQKKYEKTKPDRSTLKMIDLIFYNPATNPMESKNKSEKKESVISGGTIQEALAEEEVDEPQPMNCDSDLQSIDNDVSSLKMPVPQVKIGLNGEIILDEKSVVIETTEAKRGREDLIKNSVPIFEDRGSKVSYYRGKTRKTRDWTDFETKRFYKALNTIGPDFSLMQKYFPKRSRLELKNKFKREERLNRNLIDKALINPSEFDMTQLEIDLAFEKKAEEREIEMRLTKGVKEKQASKRLRTKSSMFGREMVQLDGENENREIMSNEVSSRELFLQEKDKKQRELGFILQKFVLNDFEKEINEKSEISPSTTSVHFSSNHCVT